MCVEETPSPTTKVRSSRIPRLADPVSTMHGGGGWGGHTGPKQTNKKDSPKQTSSRSLGSSARCRCPESPPAPSGSLGEARLRVSNKLTPSINSDLRPFPFHVLKLFGFHLTLGHKARACVKERPHGLRLYSGAFKKKKEKKEKSKMSTAFSEEIQKGKRVRARRFHPNRVDPVCFLA